MLPISSDPKTSLAKAMLSKTVDNVYQPKEKYTVKDMKPVHKLTSMWYCYCLSVTDFCNIYFSLLPLKAGYNFIIFILEFKIS